MIRKIPSTNYYFGGFTLGSAYLENQTYISILFQNVNNNADFICLFIHDYQTVEIKYGFSVVMLLISTGIWNRVQMMVISYVFYSNFRVA